MEDGDWQFLVRSPHRMLPVVPHLPTPRTAIWAALAVPILAQAPPAPALPFVFARIRTPKPIGLRALAKPLLDALHDSRRSGPYYRDCDGVAPLRDDTPQEVAGLFVESIVSAGSPSTSYVLASGWSARSRLIARLDVPVAAPNDVPGTPAESERIRAARAQYVRAVADAWGVSPLVPATSYLVIEHRPGRDEDNTWETWIDTLRQGIGWSADAWTPRFAPFARDWRPKGLGSFANPLLECAVRYHFYAEP